MSTPLPERLRPKSLYDFVGQGHVVGRGKIINKLLRSAGKTDFFPSVVFWGPPGCGKTTLARIISTELKRDFFEFSAVSTSTKDIQKVLEGEFLKPPVVFIDEIHRFNKAQQDKLLPHVERGGMILIGATTENPSFEIIRPLLSRSRVIVLYELTEEDLKIIIQRGLKELGVGLEKDAEKFLVEASGGDGRVILNVLEISTNLTGNKTLKTKNIEEALQRRQLSGDKQGEEYYNVISAFIKSMRASDTDAALYYLARMLEAGQDPLYIARRMVIFASEDVGVAQPTAMVVANEVFRACETIGYPECAINLAHGTVYLARDKKNRSAYDAYQKAKADVHKYGNLPVPKKLRNPVTKLMKGEGCGRDYEMYGKKSYLPEKLKGKKYFRE